MSTVYLIRHGITEGNKRRLYYGAADIPLIDEGFEAIRLRREAGIYPNPEGFSFITSDLLRTEQTLFEIYGEVPHEKDPMLNEINFGKFEMKSYEELKDDPEYIEWISGDNLSNVCPGGESGVMLLERASKAFGKYTDGNYIIVCHGGVILALMSKMFPDEGKNQYEWQPNPCEGYRVDFKDGRPTGYSEIKL